LQKYEGEVYIVFASKSGENYICVLFSYKAKPMRRNCRPIQGGPKK